MKIANYILIITRNTILVFLVIVLNSCQKKHPLHNLSSAKLKYDNQIILSKLKQVSLQDSLVYNGTIIYLGNKVFVKGFEDILLAFDKKNIYILNNEFRVNHKINLSDNDYLISGQIRDLDVYKNCIYILDSNSDVVKYDLNNGDIEKIVLDKKTYNLVNFRTAFNINVIDENSFLLTNMIVPRDINLKNEKIILGVIVDLEGKMVKTISINRIDADLENWNIVGDRIYAKRNDNHILLSFWLSRKVFLYDILKDTYTLKQLSVDKTWKEPKIKGGIKKLGEGIYAEEIDCLPINLNGLQISNKYIFQIMNRYNNRPIIIKYDQNINEIERKVFYDVNYKIGEITKFYMLHIVGNRVILQSANEFIHYE